MTVSNEKNPKFGHSLHLSCKKMLEEFGMFKPFGAAINSDFQILPAGGYDEKDYPSNEDLYVMQFIWITYHLNHSS